MFGNLVRIDQLGHQVVCQISTTNNKDVIQVNFLDPFNQGLTKSDIVEMMEAAIKRHKAKF